MCVCVYMFMCGSVCMFICECMCVCVVLVVWGEQCGELCVMWSVRVRKWRESVCDMEYVWKRVCSVEDSVCFMEYQ